MRAVMFFVIYCLAAKVFAAETVFFTGDSFGVPLGNALEYRVFSPQEDPSLEVVRKFSDWEKSTSAIPNFGFTSQHYWFKLKLHAGDESNQYILDIHYALLDYVEVFITGSGRATRSFRAGNNVAFSERPIEHRSFLFPINTDPNTEYEVYIHAYGDKSVQLPLLLWPTQKFWEHDQRYTLMQGLYYGIITVMMLYNLFLYFSLKQKMYLYYVFMICSIGIFQLALNGVGYAYIWTASEWWNQRGIACIIPACNGFSSLFSYAFLNVRVLCPAIAPIHLLAIRLSFVMMALAFLIAPQYTVPISTILAFCSSFIVIYLLYRFWSKERAIMYFGIAWAGLLVGSESIALNKLGILPNNFFTENGLQLGSAFESVLLSLALGELIKKLQLDKASAEKAELVAREESLVLAQKELEARNANKAKSDFLAAMSHEIRTPMNGVLGIAELLKDTGLNKEQKEYVDVIHNSGHALVTIINDILDYSKIEAGKLNLEIIEFDIDQLIEESIALFSNKANDKNITLIAIRDPNLPQLLLGDPNRIKQILFNFMSNALKFTESGFVVVQAALKELKNDKIKIKFDVIDSGIGLTAEQMPQLFQQYTQADNSIARKYGGTGLGLTICKSLAILMGGDIGVTSKPGEGSNFWFDVALKSAAEPTNAVAEPQDKKVLIILDEIRINPYVEAFFRSVGLEPTLMTSSIAINADAQLLSSFESVVLFGAEANLSDYVKKLLLVLPKQAIYLIANKLTTIAPNIAFIALPLHRRKWSQTLDKAESATKQKSVIHSQISCHVLMVEDNPVNQMVLKGLLKRNKVSFDIAENGEIALELFKASHGKYDLILMDCEMPIMDGYETTRHIRAWELSNSLSYTPVIALTAHAMQDYRDKAMSAGMDDYLTKPIDPSALERLLMHYVFSRVA